MEIDFPLLIKKTQATTTNNLKKKKLIWKVKTLKKYIEKLELCVLAEGDYFEHFMK